MPFQNGAIISKLWNVKAGLIRSWAVLKSFSGIFIYWAFELLFKNLHTGKQGIGDSLTRVGVFQNSLHENLYKAL